MAVNQIIIEKEAAEYQIRKHHQRLYGHKPVVMKELNTTYKDGFNDGYNKANEWHYPGKGDLPQCDENTQLIFYVKDWNKITNDYYYHFALGFYRPPFSFDGGKMFVEESKGYSSEHSPKYVIMWKEIVPPKVNQ